MWQSMKIRLVMGDQCHWLPVRQQEGEASLQVRENEDAGSWKGSPGLPWFQGANIGRNSEKHCLVQDHLAVSSGAISSAQETPFFPVSRSPQGWREPGLLLVQTRRAHGCGYMTYGLTRVLHWWRLLFLQSYGNNPPADVNHC